MQFHPSSKNITSKENTVTIFPPLLPGPAPGRVFPTWTWSISGVPSRRRPTARWTLLRHSARGSARPGASRRWAPRQWGRLDPSWRRWCWVCHRMLGRKKNRQVSYGFFGGQKRWTKLEMMGDGWVDDVWVKIGWWHVISRGHSQFLKQCWERAKLACAAESFEVGKRWKTDEFWINCNLAVGVGCHFRR